MDFEYLSGLHDFISYPPTFWLQWWVGGFNSSVELLVAPTHPPLQQATPSALMGGTREIPHSCHRKRRGAHFCCSPLLRCPLHIQPCFYFDVSDALVFGILLHVICCVFISRRLRRHGESFAKFEPITPMGSFM